MVPISSSRRAERTVVQAKCWKKNVGVKAVQEVVASRAMYGAERAIVVTNSFFTRQARSLAAKNGVELWDRDELLKALLRRSDAATASVVGGGSGSAPLPALPSPPSRPTAVAVADPEALTAAEALRGNAGTLLLLLLGTLGEFGDRQTGPGGEFADVVP